LAVTFIFEDWDMAAAANIKIFSRIKKKQQQLHIRGGSYCSICGKKLKRLTRRTSSK
jgi:hypothetical protein